MRGGGSKALWVAAAMLAGLALAPLGRGDTITLKEQAYVKGPTILLKDIADIESDEPSQLESVEVAPAAVPGSVKRVDAALLVSRLKNSGVDVAGLEVKGAPSVKATTLHLEITQEMLEGELREYIEKHMPWDPALTSIEVSVPNADYRVPDGEVSMTWRPSGQCSYLGHTGFRGEIRVDGIVKKNVLCTADIETEGEILVAKSEIARGKIIMPDDIEIQRRSFARLPEGTIKEFEDVVGCVARTSLIPGQVLTRQHIAPRKLIKRNQIVSVEIESGGVWVRSQARALADACAGDIVMCTNLNSKDTFQGLLRKDGVVVVY